MIKDYEILRQVSLFDLIAREELEQLLHCLHAKRKTYHKDQMLIMTGDPVSTVGIVLDGSVRVLRENPDGNQSILAQLGQGELFAETVVCAELNHSPFTVQAASDCIVLTMNYRRIITVCPAACMFHNRLIGNMLRLLSRENLVLNSRVEVLTQRTTRDKVLNYLTQLQKQNGTPLFSIPYTRQELADFLCVERSALSRELCHMRDAGILKFQKNQFELLKNQEDPAYEGV